MSYFDTGISELLDIRIGMPYYIKGVKEEIGTAIRRTQPPFYMESSRRSSALTIQQQGFQRLQCRCSDGFEGKKKDIFP